MLIYSISCLHAIPFVSEHFWFAFVGTRKILIRTASIDAPFLSLERLCCCHCWHFFHSSLNSFAFQCACVQPWSLLNSSRLYHHLICIISHAQSYISHPRSLPHHHIIRQVEDLLCIQINAFLWTKEKREKRLCILVLYSSHARGTWTMRKMQYFCLWSLRCNQARLTSWISRAREYHPFCCVSLLLLVGSLSSFLLLIFFFVPRCCWVFFFATAHNVFLAFVPPSFNLFCYCDNFLLARSVFSLFS